eukprot:Polyplicarium_translucidae@DN199_c0_g1_i2.p1
MEPCAISLLREVCACPIQHIMSEGLTSPVAVGLIFGSLIVFTIFGFTCATPKTMGEVLNPEDNFYSARGTQTWWPLGVSFFATVMGPWALTAVPEAAIISGWWGLVGYALASSCLPFMVMMWLGPRVVDATGGRAFTSVDFIYERYGRMVFALFLCVVGATLFLDLTATLAASGGAIAEITDPKFHPAALVVPLAILTLILTSYAGLEVTILTDKLQGTCCAAV